LTEAWRSLKIGFAADRLQKIGLRYARELKAIPEIAPHLASDALGGLSGS